MSQHQRTKRSPITTSFLNSQQEYLSPHSGASHQESKRSANMSDHNRQVHQSSSNTVTYHQLPSRKREGHYEKVNQDSLAKKMAKIREIDKKRVLAQRFEKVDWIQKIEADKHYYYHIEGKGVSRFDPSSNVQSKEGEFVTLSTMKLSRAYSPKENHKLGIIRTLTDINPRKAVETRC